MNNSVEVMGLCHECQHLSWDLPLWQLNVKHTFKFKAGSSCHQTLIQYSLHFIDVVL